MTDRQRARTLALQALFEADLTQHDAAVALERHIDEGQPSTPVAARARALVQGVAANRPDLDAQIGRAAPAFPVEQIATVDRNILRLALYEMLKNNDTPVRLVVNEAVELAKVYGSDSSRRFVNGVLGSIAATAVPADA